MVAQNAIPEVHHAQHTAAHTRALDADPDLAAWCVAISGARADFAVCRELTELVQLPVPVPAPGTGNWAAF